MKRLRGVSIQVCRRSDRGEQRVCLKTVLSMEGEIKKSNSDLRTSNSFVRSWIIFVKQQEVVRSYVKLCDFLGSHEKSPTRKSEISRAVVRKKFRATAWYLWTMDKPSQK
jgi:hypothetical protein